MFIKCCAIMAFGFLFTSTFAQKSTSILKYPVTEKGKHTDTYFGTVVADPYRWLEDDRAEDTKNWVQKQVAFTQNYLDKIPFRQEISRQLKEIWNYEKISAPFKEGNYTYFYKNDGLQAQSVLYRTDLAGKTEVFLDPNTFSKAGTTSLAGISFNKKGNLVAYSISEGGSDWNKIIIMDAETKKILDEPVIAKFSGAGWQGDAGFYYSKYDQPKDGSVLSGMTDTHKVYFHKLGTAPSEDKIIIGGADFKRRYMGISVSDDERYLILSASDATNGNELYIKDLQQQNSDFKAIQLGYDFNTDVVETVGNTIYIITDKNAPNKKLQKFDITNPSAWQDVIPETKDVLNVSKGGGFLYAEYIQDAVSVVKQYDFSGKLIRTISLPGKGSASGFDGKKEDRTLYFSFSNYTTPPSIFKIDTENGKTELYKKPDVKFNSENFISEQVFYTSKDGTKIPMIISYKKGLKKDGKNPTILYGYGGFNISLTPSFSVVNAIWMENGGIYAVANIRGGGEYGKKWHDAGTKMEKKNVFEDFIAAGEFLQKNKYTSPQFMALSGRSNGGLLVGAVMTMKPELAKVAFPGVGVLDMLRYNKFTAGAGWSYDYGTAEDHLEMFNYLKSYSPVHNVKSGACYPSTMVITGDHDDRVVPAHSFKFGAELQAKQSCMNPVLVRIETNAGHGAGRSTDQVIAENADMLSFALFEMGFTKIKK